MSRLSKKNPYLVVSRATYQRRLRKLVTAYPWLEPWHNKITPGPGHIKLVKAFLDELTLLSGKLADFELIMLRIWTTYSGLSMLARASNRQHDEILITLTEDYRIKSMHVCGVCGYQSWKKSDQMRGRCFVHDHCTAIVKEDFDALERETKAQLKETETKTEELPAKTADESSVRRLFQLGEGPHIQLYDMDKAIQAVQASETATHDKSNRYRAMLSTLKTIGTGERELAVLPDNWREIITEFAVNFPNFKEVALLLDNHFALSDRGDRRIKLPPILLVGEAGVGKTEAVHWLAAKLALPNIHIDISVAQSSAQLTGSERFWSNSREGLLFNQLVTHHQANPIVILDELDKVSSDDRHSPLNALYALLENRTARIFHDLSYPEITLDAGHLNWFAMANQIDSISQPILSRMSIHHIAPPTQEEIRHIALSIYRQLRSSAPWGHTFSETIADTVLDRLAVQNPRVIRKTLQDALGAAARAGRDCLLPEDLNTPHITTTRRIGFCPA